jgi:hypothetical protein
MRNNPQFVKNMLNDLIDSVSETHDAAYDKVEADGIEEMYNELVSDLINSVYAAMYSHPGVKARMNEKAARHSRRARHRTRWQRPRDRNLPGW